MQLLEEAVQLGLIKKEDAESDPVTKDGEHHEQCDDDDGEDNDVAAPES